MRGVVFSLDVYASVAALVLVLGIMMGVVQMWQEDMGYRRRELELYDRVHSGLTYVYERGACREGNVAYAGCVEGVYRREEVGWGKLGCETNAPFLDCSGSCTRGKTVYRYVFPACTPSGCGEYYVEVWPC